MAELDEQLRAYADQVESTVGPTPALPAPTTPGRPVLRWVAALVLVAGAGIGIGLALDGGDDRGPDTLVDPPTPTAVMTTMTTPTDPDPELDNDLVVVPEVATLTIVETVEMLSRLPLEVDPELRVEPSPIVEGRVVRTEPEAGSAVPSGTTVTIVVSTGDGGDGGPVPVPVVIGLFADTALATIRNVGLEPVVAFRSVPFNDPRVGLVIEQTPAGFALVPGGSEVVVIVGEAAVDAPDD